jgi:hypothetical protein
MGEVGFLSSRMLQCPRRRGIAYPIRDVRLVCPTLFQSRNSDLPLGTEFLTKRSEDENTNGVWISSYLY